MVDNFPELLEQAMFEMEIDETTLAKRLNVTRQAVYKLKKSKKPRKKTIYRVARALNVRRQFFLCSDFID